MTSPDPIPEVEFNGPPPPRARKSRWAVLNDHPGEWGSFTFNKKGTASSQSSYLRKKGYESVARGTTVYGRKPIDVGS
jgi:hypothetical protein